MKIEAIPDFAAPLYDLIARRSVFMRDLRRAVVDDICSNLPSSGKVLDVGTGPGYLPLEIARRMPRLDMTGIDLSAGMVRLASRHALEAGLCGRVKFREANAACLPFAEGSFDAVVSTFSSHHWVDLTGYLNEIRRVLKKGGRALIYDFRKDISLETEAEVRGKYGLFRSFFFLRIPRIHSSLSVDGAREVIRSTRFLREAAFGRGVLLKLEFTK